MPEENKDTNTQSIEVQGQTYSVSCAEDWVPTMQLREVLVEVPTGVANIVRIERRIQQLFYDHNFSNNRKWEFLPVVDLTKQNPTG